MINNSISGNSGAPDSEQVDREKSNDERASLAR
jgi:hypothetical protein